MGKRMLRSKELAVEVRSKGEGKKPGRKEVGENVGYGKWEIGLE